MKKQTRQVFGQYETRLGQLNDTDNVAKTFSVTPSVQQKLETKMQESSEFLTKVNIIGVTEQEGEKLGLGVSGPIAGRTNTKDKELARFLHLVFQLLLHAGRDAKGHGHVVRVVQLAHAGFILAKDL